MSIKNSYGGRRRDNAIIMGFLSTGLILAFEPHADRDILQRANLR